MLFVFPLNYGRWPVRGRWNAAKLCRLERLGANSMSQSIMPTRGNANNSIPRLKRHQTRVGQWLDSIDGLPYISIV